MRYIPIMILLLAISGCTVLQPVDTAPLLQQYGQARVQLTAARTLYEQKKAQLTISERVAMYSAIGEAEFLLSEADRLAASDSPVLTSTQATILAERTKKLQSAVSAVVDTHRATLTEDEQLQIARLDSALQRLSYYFFVAQGQQKDRKEAILEIAGIVAEVGKGIAGLLL